MTRHSTGTVMFKVPFNIFDTGIRIPDILIDRIETELVGKTWVPHFMKLMVDNGNSAIQLVTSDGQIDNDDGSPNHRFDLPMLPNQNLIDMPVTNGVWGRLGVGFHRSRFMRIAPGGHMPEHYDAHPYWRDKCRVHIPIQTDPSVIFSCGGDDLHMERGRVYLIDNSELHTVSNPSTQNRIHLVIDVPLTDVPRLTNNTQIPPDRLGFRLDDPDFRAPTNEALANR